MLKGSLWNVPGLSSSERAHRSIRIRRMKRKWASCSTRGNVTLNVELLSQPAAFRAEAIVHELLHFRVPNHGPLFRALLKGYLARGCKP